jgi:hypothetical protein
MNSNESNVSGKVAPTPLEKEIDSKFSQSWQVYRIAMHDKGSLELAMEMSWKYSTKGLYDMLELLDVHDALTQQAVNKAKADKNKIK